MRTIDMIVIHCTASPNGRPLSVAQIRKEHLARGFSDIGYHYVIDVDGTISVGRPIAQVGAHAQGYNAHSVGVSMVGGLGGADKVNPGLFTPAQWASLQKLVQDLLTHYPGCRIVGHRDLSPDLDGDGIIEPREYIKLCPTFEVSEWLQAGMIPDAKHIIQVGVARA